MRSHHLYRELANMLKRFVGKQRAKRGRVDRFYHTAQNNGDQRAMSGRNGYLTGQKRFRTNSRILTCKS